MDAFLLHQWLAALDQISYYELFRVSSTATHDELRAAFHAFAEDFHPDAHAGRPPSEQAAVARIYKRGSEAWRILSDDGLRARYDDALAHGILRPEDLIVERDSMRPRTGPPSMSPPGMARPLADQLRAPAARPFVLRAEELLKNGDPKQAKLQLVMALHFDKGNPALEAFGVRIDEAIAEAEKKDAERWSRPPPKA
jgi:curved DNA-binding protein CbpA